MAILGLIQHSERPELKSVILADTLEELQLEAAPHKIIHTVEGDHVDEIFLERVTEALRRREDGETLQLVSRVE